MDDLSHKLCWHLLYGGHREHAQRVTRQRQWKCLARSPDRKHDLGRKKAKSSKSL